jgi:hypothetical protein
VNLFALLPFAGFVANLALAAFVLARHPRAAANRLYALLTIAIAYWCILKFAWRSLCSGAATLLRCGIDDGIVLRAGRGKKLPIEKQPAVNTAENVSHETQPQFSS